MASSTETYGNGLDSIVIKSNNGSTAQITNFGAHVVSWKTADGRERIFISDDAVLDGSKAIRGGVPICWPQFAGDGPLKNHGYARTSLWNLDTSEQAEGVFGGEGEAYFTLSSEAFKEEWPHDASLRYTVRIGDDSLFLALTVQNTGSADISFSTALHTYFAVPDATAAAVNGLTGLTYIDKTNSNAEVVEENDQVTVSGEVDRKYLGTPAHLELVVDPETTLAIDTENFTDAVVWNPWIEKAAAMGDFGNEEYKKMICVESGTVGNAVVLGAGETWSASVTYTAAQ